MVEQATPFNVKLVGLGFEPLNEILNPKLTVPPLAGMVAFQSKFRTVTAAPLWVKLPHQRLVICWLPGKVQANVQPLTAAAVLFFIVTLIVAPLLH